MNKFEQGRTYRWAGLGSDTPVRTFEVVGFEGRTGEPTHRAIIEIRVCEVTKLIGARQSWNPNAVDRCVDMTEYAPKRRTDDDLVLISSGNVRAEEFTIPRPPKG